MHIAVLFQHYHTPDCPTAARPYSLVKRLAKSFDVTLIASNAFRKKRLTHDFAWVPDGVRLLQVDVSYDNAMPPTARALSFARFTTLAALRGFTLPKPDLVFGSSTPITVGLAARAIAARFRVPWVFEVRDLWPDFPIQIGAVPEGLPADVLRWLERSLYDSAARVVTASPDMQRHVERISSTPVQTISYGTDRELLSRASKQDTPFLSELAQKREHLVCYAGRLGRANAIPSLLQSIELLAHRTDITFALAGDGYHAEGVRQQARQQGNLELLPPLPHLQALELMRRASLSLVTFLDLPVLGANAPSKLFDSLSAGTPVVVTNNGWAAGPLCQHNCGWIAKPEDPPALAQTIEEALDQPDELKKRGARARELAAERFDRAAHMEQMVALLRSTVAESR